MTASPSAQARTAPSCAAGAAAGALSAAVVADVSGGGVAASSARRAVPGLPPARASSPGVARLRRELVPADGSLVGFAGTRSATESLLLAVATSRSGPFSFSVCSRPHRRYAAARPTRSAAAIASGVLHRMSRKLCVRPRVHPATNRRYSNSILPCLPTSARVSRRSCCRAGRKGPRQQRRELWPFRGHVFRKSDRINWSARDARLRSRLICRRLSTRRGPAWTLPGAPGLQGGSDHFSDSAPSPTLGGFTDAS